jgi:hypothetical protein
MWCMIVVGGTVYNTVVARVLMSECVLRYANTAHTIVHMSVTDIPYLY